MFYNGVCTPFLIYLSSSMGEIKENIVREKVSSYAAVIYVIIITCLIHIYVIMKLICCMLHIEFCTGSMIKVV